MKKLNNDIENFTSNVNRYIHEAWQITDTGWTYDIILRYQENDVLHMIVWKYKKGIMMYYVYDTDNHEQIEEEIIDKDLYDKAIKRIEKLRK